MKVFVAGATGVIGRRAVPALVAGGHEVTGVARTPEKAALLQGLGATPVTVDLFDPAAVRSAAAGHDAVCNLATHIPPLTKAALPRAWAENDRIRTEASANLAAAVEGGRFVQESITFPYRDGGDDWLDEDTPYEAPGFTQSVETAEAAAHAVDGVVLRFGMFYAPDAAHTLDIVRLARKRVAALIGKPEAYASQIHAEDAGSAVVAALTAPPGTYNVVEDEPMRREDIFAVLAEVLGTKPPRKVPTTVAKLGGAKSTMLMRSQRVSNRRFKDATGWSPRYPSQREGLPAVVRDMADA